jgi:D-3-phosphoglycerate dehydrogenase
MYKVLVTAMPFGKVSDLPLKILKKKNIKIIRSNKNDINKKILDCDFYIAGTEQVSSETILLARKLKLICRIGIGLDNLNLELLKKKNIQVSYTPDAQSSSVAEFTIGLIIALTRNIVLSNDLNKRSKAWIRPIGNLLISLNIGIIGFGRIGAMVYRKLNALGVKNIYCYDIDIRKKKELKNNFKNLEFLLKNSNVLTFHIPSNKNNKNYINMKLLKKCKKIPYLINTSRGDIVNENDLIKAYRDKLIKGAALDVFKDEPKINKNFKKISNFILTSHIAASTKVARKNMEFQCVESIIKFIENKKDLRRVI